jgi:hypothetical protein
MWQDVYHKAGTDTLYLSPNTTRHRPCTPPLIPSKDTRGERNIPGLAREYCKMIRG